MTTLRYDYSNSQVFNKLKRIDETIKRNWSTEQYLNALDTLIENMMYPVLRSCRFLDLAVAGILSWYSDASNNKITTYERGEAIHYMMNFLTRVTPDEKSLVLRRLRFDRNISFILVDIWMSKVGDYRTLVEHRKIEQSQFIERVVQHNPGKDSALYAAIPQVQFWQREALELRQQILQKYYRLVLLEAKNFYEEMQYSISLDDTVQKLIIEAQIALDKCNQEKGTITSYMQRWIHFARSKMNTEMDTAYSVPGKARQGDFSYKAESLEELDSHTPGDDSFNVFLDVSHVRKIARLMDPIGIGRYSLGIEEYTSDLTKANC